MVSYLGWEDYGGIIVPGAWDVADIRRTVYGDKGYALGRQLK